MIGRKLKISILTLALILLCTNVAFAFSWGSSGCYSELKNQIYQIYGYSVTTTDTVCDEVYVFGELYRDGVRVDYDSDLRTEATWAQADTWCSNPLGLQRYGMFGYHRAKDGLEEHEATSYNIWDF